MKVLLLACVLLMSLSTASGADTWQRGRRHAQRQVHVKTQPEAAAPDPDDLYRRRGYGIGGNVFGLGQGGTAMAGACADLRAVAPRSCGRGYGVYGNGLGYGFGL